MLLRIRDYFVEYIQVFKVCNGFAVSFEVVVDLEPAAQVG